MLNYAMKCAMEALKIPRRAVLATNGPAGILASEFSCESVGLSLYLLVPRDSDHLFNLENDPSVSLVTAVWELKGQAQILTEMPVDLHLGILDEPDCEWYALVRIGPQQIHFLREKGSGRIETIDFT